jgi:hypothetical protein
MEVKRGDHNMTRNLFCSAAIVLLLSFTLSAPGEEGDTTATGDRQPERASESQWVESLVSADVGIRSQAYRELSKGRERIVSKLIEIAGSDPVGGRQYDSSRRVAITLLGEYRAEEAVDALVRLLLYEEKPSFAFSRDPVSMRYPAALALAKIGVPATQKTIVRLGETQDATEVELCVYILYRIYGKDIATTICRESMEAPHGDHRKANFQKALKLLSGEEKGEILKNVSIR